MFKWSPNTIKKITQCRHVTHVLFDALVGQLFTTRAHAHIFFFLPPPGPTSFPETANFLRRMLDENEGSGKDWF